MKASLSLLFFLTLTMSSFAQNIFQEGMHLTNVGFGIGSNYGPSSFDILIPPLGVSYEYGISKQVSVGGYLGTTANRFDQFRDDYSMDVFYFITGVRASYHLNKLLGSRKFDPYAGAVVGYNFFQLNDPEDRYRGPELGNALAGLHAGVRYYFKKHIGLFGELGLGIAVFQCGLALRY